MRVVTALLPARIAPAFAQTAAARAGRRPGGRPFLHGVTSPRERGLTSHGKPSRHPPSRVHPASEPAHGRAPRLWRRRARRAVRADLDPPRLHARADHGPDLRCRPRRRLARLGAGDGEHAPVPARRARGAPRLLRAQARLGGHERLDRRLPARLHRRGGADRLARRARLGPALLVVDLGDAQRQRRHLRLRPALAPSLAGRARLRSSWQTTLEDGLYPFVAADLVKLYLAAPRCRSPGRSSGARSRRTPRRPSPRRPTQFRDGSSPFRCGD